MSTLSWKEVLQLPAYRFIHKSPGKNCYVVNIRGSNGLKVSDNNIHVFFADSMKELNKKLDWMTDGNWVDMEKEAVEALKELYGLSENTLKEITSKIIYDCKVAGVMEGLDQEKFYQKYGHMGIKEIA